MRWPCGSARRSARCVHRRFRDPCLLCHLSDTPVRAVFRFWFLSLAHQPRHPFIADRTAPGRSSSCSPDPLLHESSRHLPRSRWSVQLWAIFLFIFPPRSAKRSAPESPSPAGSERELACFSCGPLLRTQYSTAFGRPRHRHLHCASEMPFSLQY